MIDCYPEHNWDVERLKGKTRSVSLNGSKYQMRRDSTLEERIGSNFKESWRRYYVKKTRYNVFQFELTFLPLSGSFYQSGRSKTLFKVKEFLDDEALAIGYNSTTTELICKQ